MEPRHDASRKENVPPRPATPLRPGKRLERRRFPKSRGVGQGSGHGRWVRECSAEREGPATIRSPGAERRQEPCRVQTNLAGPSLILKDATGRLVNSGLQQQSNLQTPAGRPQGRARELVVQQSNLSIRGTSLAEGRSHLSPRLRSELQGSFWPHLIPQGSPLSRASLANPPSSLRQSRWLGTDTPCPDVQPAAGFASLSGHTLPGSGPWCVLGNWPPRLMGEPLTLEDLTVPVQSQARAPSQTAIHQLLASVRHLEHEVARLGCRASQEPPGPAHRDPWTSSGRALPAHRQPGQPALASWEGREKPVRGLRETADFPGTQGAQAGLSDGRASSKPASLEATLRMPTGDFLDPKQGALLANPSRQGENFCPGPTYGSRPKRDPRLPPGVGNREARPCSAACSSAARGGPPGQKGREVALQELVGKEEERTASCPPDAAPARSALQNKARNVGSLESGTARCFRAWWHRVRKRRAVAVAVALGRRRLLRRGLRALRWALRLREAQLEVAWKRHTQALLAQSFRKWRNQTLQQKQGQPRVQAGPGPPPSGTGQGQSPSGREPGADPAWRSSPGSQREEAGAWQRPDGGDGEVQMLQALQQLAGFLFWKEWARQERRVQGEASRATLRTQRRGRPPQAWRSHAADAPKMASLDTQQQRAWLGRCFGAWQQFVQRGARYRDRLAHRRARTLRICLQQWVRMKQLQASDGAKVTQLSLCRQKAGNVALCSSAPGVATAQGLGTMAQVQGGSSLREACRRLALRRALLLWRTRLSQRRKADSFLRGMRQQMIRRILKGWCLRAWGPGTPSDSARTTLAPELLDSIPVGEDLLGCSTPRSSLEKVSRAPTLLETLRLSFVWAAGRQQKRRCLLLWQVRAQQSRRAARWHRCALRRRILLGWSHWATAQGAQRELAVGWAWDRSCRAALGLWRRRLAQRLQAERCVRARDRTLVRGALRRWHGCWQRRQLLHEKYQQWMQVQLQGLRRSVFRDWRRAAAHRRRTAAPPEQPLLQSHFQAPCGVVRDTGVFPATRAFRDGLRRALGTTFSMWREAGAAKAWAQEQHVARVPVTHWRSRARGGPMDQQLRRVLEAWAQAAARGRVQGAAITQFRQAASRRLLWTCWAQWRAVLLSGQLEQQEAEAQEACPVDRRQRPRVASRGRLLALMDTPAPWKQTHRCRTRPSPTRHHGRGGPKEQREMSWAQSDREPPLCRAFQVQLQWPGRTGQAQGPPPGKPGGDCSSEASVLKGQGVAAERQLGRRYLQRWHLEALLRRLQGSQQARRLAATWQHWVDAQGEEQLARTLLRQWHLKRAWGAWRRRVLRLRAARRLQQQEGGRVLSQAFEKWCQQLAARGRKRGATSSPGPPEQGGHRDPGSRLEAAGVDAKACPEAWDTARRAALPVPATQVRFAIPVGPKCKVTGSPRRGVLLTKEH
ncbi:uncharacterized protein C1orf167 homolog [Prionailurus viverrinus]|uniref:uncharacterized protein C1orf167 homolog n=1 Tax=Prionailurus viverrinus TaxID=61388 RepID=UPI001FF1CB60|nr:uncharacterized protein C1orf167 homolog [Prionailurus viverrinus]